MKIPSHELHAFQTVARTLNFSVAAECIHITQSALSQRIRSLESRLGVILLTRDRRAIKLTEAGMRLLRYCRMQDHFETELVGDLVNHSADSLSGHLRIAAFSSVLHSVIMPSLSTLLRIHPGIHFEFSMYEVYKLPEILLQSAADFVVMDRYHQKDNLITHLLGEEQYVLIQSTDFAVSTTYLDHDHRDKQTRLFFNNNFEESKTLSFSYVNDIQGVLQGVALGLGQGIVPLHLVKPELPIKIVNETHKMRTPLVLHYFKQPYYSRLQKATIDALQKNCVKYLEP